MHKEHSLNMSDQKSGTKGHTEELNFAIASI